MKRISMHFLAATALVGAAFLAMSCTTTGQKKPATATSTPTETYTFSRTPTRTYTLSFSNTNTRTHTNTRTYTHTFTNSNTFTITNTPGPTATGTYIYIWGGDDPANARLSTCYSAQVTGPGTLGPWMQTSPMPGMLTNLGYCSNSQYIFAVGGVEAAEVSTVYYAPYGGGSAGPWAQASPLPVTMELMGAGIASGRMWVWGNSGTSTYSSPLVGNLPTTWTPATAAPTVAVNAHWGCDGSYLYHVGGTTPGAGPTPFSDSWSAQANAGGTVGAWTTGAMHPTTICYGGYGHFAGYLWSVAGSTTNWGANIVSTVFAAPASGGTIGAWVTSANLPVPLIQAGATSIGGYFYVVGGFQTMTGPANTVFAGQISSGMVSSWTTLASLPYHVEAHGIAAK